LHGLSAGAGKIGSIIAQGAIAPLRTRGATGKPGSNGLDDEQHLAEMVYLFGTEWEEPIVLGCR
jgi:PHS family inorganic phosphate transporter-like MFS transporter